MKRFILVTFGFLGLGFYELSGGDDFDPAEAREMAMETRQQLELARLDRPAVQVAALAPAPVADTPAPVSADRDVVARSSLNLVSLASLEATETPQITPVTDAEPAPVLASDAAEPAPALIRVAGIAAIDDTYQDITFAGLSTSASSENVAPAARDIRRVTGSVVNMRSGPGTGFDVIDQLSENTRVEVIDDAGNGWVQLRPLDGGDTGWMADFLLADG